MKKTSRYSTIFTKSLIFLVSITLLITTQGIIKIPITIFILFLIPGFSLLSYYIINRRWNMFDILITSFIIGLSTQMLLAYFLSLFNINFLDYRVSLIISYIFLFFSKNIETKKIELKDYKIISILLLLFFINFLIFTTPMTSLVAKSFREVGPFPPGDDSKHHIMLIGEILKHKKIPDTYPFYETKIRYPLGFHIILSEIYTFNNVNLFHLIFYFGIFMASFSVFTFYLLGKHMFNEKVGITFSTLSLTIIPILKFVAYGMYPSLLGFITQPVFILFLYLYIKENRNLIAPILLSSLFVINSYPFLISFLTIFLMFFYHKRKMAEIILITFILISPALTKIFPFSHLPSINQNVGPPENIMEILPSSFFGKKMSYFLYNIDFLIINFSLATLAIIGLNFIEKDVKKLIILMWLISPLILFISRYIFVLPLNNLIWYLVGSFWFWVEDIRFFYYLSIPLALLSSIFVSKITKTNKQIIIILIILLIYPMLIKIFRSDEIEYRAFSIGDYNYIEWVKNNITSDSVIYNDYWRGTTSTWIPVLSGKNVTFPFNFYTNDMSFFNSCVERHKMKVVRIVPDSKEALDVMKEYNASYITFSTYFTTEYLPDFDEKKFTEPCFTKLYGRDENWVFKINYDCPTDSYINLITYDFTKQNFCMLNRNDIRLCSKDEVKSKGLKIQNTTNILFDLNNIHVDPFILEKSTPYLFIYHNISGGGVTKVKYGFEDKYNFVNYNITQYFVYKDYLLTPLELPKDFIKEKDPIVWFQGEPLFAKNASVYIKLPEIKKISDNIYLQGSWEIKNNKFIVNKSSLNSRILLKVDEPSKLIIEYIDSSYGAVDLNYYDGEWKALDVIRRTDRDNIVFKEFNINKSTLFGINIIPYNEKFEITGLYLIPRNSIFIKNNSEITIIQQKKQTLFNESYLQTLPSLKRLSDKIYIQGDWIIDNGYYKISPNNTSIKLIIFNVTSGYLKFEYEDLGYGVVDLNYYDYYLNDWINLDVIKRQNSNKFIGKKIPIKPSNSNVFNFGIFSYDDIFTIKNLEFIPN